MKIFSNFARKLDEIFASIHNKLNTIIMNEDQLKALLAKLPDAIAQVKTDTEALIAKAAASGIDLSSEGATVTASLQSLADIHTEATGGTVASTAPAPASYPSTNNGATQAAPTTGS